MCISVHQATVVIVGYIYSNGVNALVLGACYGLAGATGIIGTFLFTRLRKQLGLERTGIIAFSAEAACLSLAVASVWAPGSPFDLHYASRSPTDLCNNSSSLNFTGSSVIGGDGLLNMTSCESSSESDALNVSIILLLVGIISSRIGK